MESLFATELSNIVSEARAKKTDKGNALKELAERALVVLKTVKPPATPDKKPEYIEELQSKDEVFAPLLPCFESKNPKLVMSALTIIQRVVQFSALPVALVPGIIKAFDDILDLGNDVHLRVIQAILAFLTNYTMIHGPVLAQAFGICFKVYNMKTPLTTSVAGATLSQMVLLLFEKASSEADDELAKTAAAAAAPAEVEVAATPAAALKSLPPSAKDAFAVLQDICLLSVGDSPEFLPTQPVTKSLGLELIEAVLVSHHDLFVKLPSFQVLLKDRVSPLVIKSYSDRSQYSQTARLMRVMRALLQHFSKVLLMECEIFLSMLVKTLDGHYPPWQRALALEVFRPLCGDVDSLRQFFRNYDQQESSTNVFADMINSCSRIVQSVTEDAAKESGTSTTTVDGEKPQAAPTAFPSVSVRVSYIDQLDKTDPPAVQENYLPSLALNCLVAIVDSLSADVLPIFTLSPSSSGGDSAMMLEKIDMSQHAQRELLLEIRAMLLAGWSGLLGAFSQVAQYTLDEDVHGTMLRTFQAVTTLCGVMGLDQPRDAFIMTLSRFATPNWDDVSTYGAYAFSEQNFQAIRTVFNVAQCIGGMLGPAWYYILELLQSVEIALKLASGAPGQLSTPNQGPGSASSLTLPPIPAVITPVMDTDRSSSLPGTPMANLISTIVDKVEMKDKKDDREKSLMGTINKRRTQMHDENVQILAASLSRLFSGVTYLNDEALLQFIEALSRLANESAKPKNRAQLKALAANFGGDIRSFGMERLMETALNTLPRLLASSGEGSWSATVSFLLVASASDDGGIRHQASETVAELCVRALAMGNSLQAEDVDALHTRLLSPVLSLAISAHSDVQVQQLETLYQILQTHGLEFRTVWPMVLDVFTQVADQDLKHSRPVAQDAATTRLAFQSLQFICTDLLSYLSVGILHQVIRTLGRFSVQPADVNIALTAVGLMWSVSDYARSCRNALTREPTATSSEEELTSQQIACKPQSTAEIDTLWLQLLTELCNIANDERPEVRNGAAQSLFRIVLINGALFELATWQVVLWKVLFPLLDNVKEGAKTHHSERLAKSQGREAAKGAQNIILHHSRNTSEKQWDETRVIAFTGVCSTFNRGFSMLMTLDDFQRAWLLLLEFFEDFAQNHGQEVAMASFRGVEELLQHPKKDVSEETLVGMVDLWRSTWLSWEKVGMSIVKVPVAIKQDCILALIRSFESLFQLYGAHFKSGDYRRLLAVLRGLLVYPLDDPFVRDVEHATPVQSLILKSVLALDPSLAEILSQKNPDELGDDEPAVAATSTTPAAVSPHARLLQSMSPDLLNELRGMVLSELAEYASIAFQRKRPSEVVAASSITPTASADGETPPVVLPADKPGHATYLGLCRMCMDHIVHVFAATVHSKSLYEDGVFEKILSAFSVPMGLKYDCPTVKNPKHAVWKSAVKNYLLVVKNGLKSLESLRTVLHKETFERIWTKIIHIFRAYLLSSSNPPSTLAPEDLNDDEMFDVSVVTSIRTELIPLMHGILSDLVMELVDIFQQGSLLLQVEPDTGTDHIVTREKFAAACLSSLFDLSAEPSEFASLPSSEQQHRRQVATVVAHIMVERCESVIRSYLHDRSVHGNLPISRNKHDELLYTLTEIARLQLMSGVLKGDGRATDKSIFEGRNAHLFYLYPSIVECITSGDRQVVEAVRSILRRVGTEIGLTPSAPAKTNLVFPARSKKAGAPSTS